MQAKCIEGWQINKVSASFDTFLKTKTLRTSGCENAIVWRFS